MQALPTTLAATLLLAVGPATALAGPLASTARSVDHKSSSDTSSSSSSSSSSSDSDASDSSWYDDSDSSSSSSCSSCSNTPVRIELIRPEMELRVAAQDVRRSDGSLRLETLAMFERVGLFASGDYYYEHIAAKGHPSEDVRVNLFELSGVVRIVKTKVFHADLRGGFAGALSSHFDGLAGGALGVAFTAKANDIVSLRAEGRAMIFQHDIRAFEAAAGAMIGIGWLGYRALKFDVGETLEGPEAGLRFEF